jgi:hypothetical protein
MLNYWFKPKNRSCSIAPLGYCPELVEPGFLFSKVPEGLRGFLPFNLELGLTLGFVGLVLLAFVLEGAFD